MVDTVTVYSRFQEIGIPNGPVHWEKQNLIPLGVNIFELIHSVSEIEDISTINDTTFPFPRNVQFSIDTTKITMFYEDNPGNEYTLFDFTSEEGDTIEIFCFSSIDSNSPAPGSAYIKVRIDSIGPKNYPLLGQVTCYYFHQLTQFGPPYLICDYPNSYWIKGSINGHGGILNQGQNGITFVGESECFEENNFRFPLNTNGCGVYTSVSNSNADSNFGISPNPSDGQFSVDFDRIFLKTIEITDISGRVLKSFAHHEISLPINLLGYPKGIYFLNVKSESCSSTNRLVIE